MMQPFVSKVSSRRLQQNATRTARAEAVRGMVLQQAETKGLAMMWTSLIVQPARLAQTLLLICPKGW
jgi:hypothetical protein